MSKLFRKLASFYILRIRFSREGGHVIFSTNNYQLKVVRDAHFPLQNLRSWGIGSSVSVYQSEIQIDSCVYVFRGDMNMCIRLTSYGSIHVPDRERGSPAEINSEL